MNAVASEAKSEAQRGVVQVQRSPCCDRALARKERMVALELAARQYPTSTPQTLLSAARKFADFIETGQ